MTPADREAVIVQDPCHLRHVQRIDAPVRTLLGHVADVVEDFRLEQGRLPTAEEIDDQLNPDVTYQIVGDRYTVTIAGNAGSITFDGSQDVQAWARNAWSANPSEAGP